MMAVICCVCSGITSNNQACKEAEERGFYNQFNSFRTISAAAADSSTATQFANQTFYESLTWKY